MHRLFCRLAVAGLMLVLSRPAAGQVFRPLVREGDPALGVQGLRLDAAAYETLRRADGDVEMEIPDAAGAPLRVRVSRLRVFADDARVVAASGSGEVELPLPDVQCFGGEVDGVPGSSVFVALSPLGTSGFVRQGAEQWVISSGPMGLMPTVIYDAAGPAAAGIRLDMPACAGAILPPGEQASQGEPGGYGERAGACRILRLAMDADSEFTANLFGGNQASASAYVATMVGAMTQIYRNEINIGFELGYLRLWTGDDPYTATSTSNQLPEFRAYWNSNMGSVSRNLAHLLSGRALGGGIAYLGVACSSSNGYAVSANLSGYFPYPLQHNHGSNWDIMVVSHETGHNVGTGHTHDPNSYNPPIDGCGNAYLNPPQTQDCTVAAAHQGTIMSYCHVCPGGMSNIRLEFGPRPSTVIRNFIDARPTCGTTPTLTITQHPQGATVCEGDPVVLAVTATGNATRTYQWRRNTVNIPGATGTTYAIAATGAAHAGSYDCIVSSTCVAVVTNPALLVVNACPCDGDFDQDGNVNQDDVVYLIHAIAGGPNPNGMDLDFNRDGNVDQDDVTSLIHVVGGGNCP
jgi:hypothetical protein